MKKLTLYSFMYWLPIILMFLAYIIGSIYYKDYEKIKYFFFIGIALIFSYFWFKYWDKKQDRLREKENETKNNIADM